MSRSLCPLPGAADLSLDDAVPVVVLVVDLLVSPPRVVVASVCCCSVLYPLGGEVVCERLKVCFDRVLVVPDGVTHV